MAEPATALTNPVLFQAAATGDPSIWYTATDLNAMFAALTPNEGRLTPNGLAVQHHKAAPNWSVDITAGTAAIDGQYPDQRYFVRIPGNPNTGSTDVLNVPLTGINTAPTALRLHKIWLCVYDQPVKGVGYGAKVVVTEDTTGAGAPAPSVGNPVGWMNLGTVKISPGQTSIQASHVTTSWYENTAPQMRVATGTTEFALNNNWYIAVPVNFPPARFTAPPRVAATQRGVMAGSQRLIPKTSSVSATGMNLYLYTGDGSVTTASGIYVDWIAVQEA